MEVNIIDQLETVISSKDVARRATILSKVADLFAVNSSRFSQEHVELFDDVMARLLDSAGESARAQFGDRLARMSDAPPKTIRHLALDDSIEVAGPILRYSDRIDETTLVEAARLKSQNHLLAISGRKVLVETVTDILVERGNEAVVSSTAKNGGAKFSEFGISNLIRKASCDGGLALSVWSRPDIPRQDLVKLFADASEAIRDQMMQADPRRAELIKAAVAEAADEIQERSRNHSDVFSAARSHVEALHLAGELSEGQLHAFAGEGSFEKVTVALSLLCNLPIGVVERAFVQKYTDQVLVMAKAIDLSWVTTVALLLLQAGVSGSSRQQLDQCFANFSKLQKKTALTALQFYRIRQQASKPTN